MSEYGLIRSRGFCAFFFIGMGMKPRLISRFRSLLCLADLAILQPSLIVFWKEPAPLFAAMSSDAPFGYSRPGGRGAGSRQFNPFRCRCFSGDRHYRLILRAFCGMDVPPGMRRLLSVLCRRSFQGMPLDHVHADDSPGGMRANSRHKDLDKPFTAHITEAVHL